MRLDAELFSYLTKVEWRVLESIEIGMKNHDVVPVVLISRIANLRRTGIQSVLSLLLKHKFLAHENKKYDGYKLTYLGYDFLALRAFVARGNLTGVGMRMGVGKESDIHICKGGGGESDTPSIVGRTSNGRSDRRTSDGRTNEGRASEGKTVILKLHRLGRISFRSIKRNRDYLGQRQSASWMYLARLAAAKEFAFMKALHENGFPVPEPIDLNRHAIVMEYIDGHPLSQIRELRHPRQVLEALMGLIVKMAESGLIHGDFNEFNIMISDEEKITMIDFPQIVSANHPNAEFYFNRDVECIRSCFKTKFGLEVTKYPKFSEIKIPDLLNSPASIGFNVAHQSDEERLREAFELHKIELAKREEEEEESEEGESEEEEDGASDEENRVGEQNDNDEVKESVGFVEVKISHDGSDKIEQIQEEEVEEEQETESESDGDDSKTDCGDVESGKEEKQERKRLDNVWRPTVKRKTAGSAHTEKQKKKRSTKGEASMKRNRKQMKIKAQLQHDW